MERPYKLRKRQAVQTHGQLVKHEIRGTLNHLQSFGMIDKLGVNGVYFPPGKRSEASTAGTMRNSIPIETYGDGDIFVANVYGRLFGKYRCARGRRAIADFLSFAESTIHHEVCGKDSFTGDTSNNEAGCREFLGDVVGQIDQHISVTTDFSGAVPHDFARTIGNRYTTYRTFRGADAIALQTEKSKLEERLKKNMRHSLLYKAYADQNCMLKCRASNLKPGSVHGRTPIYNKKGSPLKQKGQSVERTPGCYNSLNGHFEELYGFNNKEKWGLDEERINQASWNAYINRDASGRMPGRVDLNPYLTSIKDYSPILVVCFSEVDTSDVGDDTILSHCGNIWGSETELVANAGFCHPQNKDAEQKALRRNFHNNKAMVKNYPAAFLKVMCDAHYKIFVPPGSGSYLGTWC
jgi:hypothetical protein